MTSIKSEKPAPKFRLLKGTKLLFRFDMIFIIVLMSVMVLVSDIDGAIKGYIPFNYELGGSMVNYADGFIRRGLFGEILQRFDYVLQPIMSAAILSFSSLMLILYVFLSRMIRLKVSLPHIMAIVFSPSLLLMYRGENFFRTDAIVVSLNLIVSCFLLNRLFTGNKMTCRGGGDLHF